VAKSRASIQPRYVTYPLHGAQVESRQWIAAMIATGLNATPTAEGSTSPIAWLSTSPLCDHAATVPDEEIV